MDWSFVALSSLGPDGIQLTPGNLPTPGFRAEVARSPLAIRTHEGFSYERRKAPVWDERGCAIGSDSVHAPKLDAFDFWSWVETSEGRRTLEVMPPGLHLGSGEEIRRAMAMELPLAVDVSHVHLQLEAGTMSRADWDALAEYDAVVEVHVSRDDGKNDVHWPIDASTHGLAWARERAAGGVPLVLECYMHRMTRAEAEDQLALLHV